MGGELWDGPTTDRINRFFPFGFSVGIDVGGGRTRTAGRNHRILRGNGRIFVLPRPGLRSG
jgi:hypothetical protein